MAIIPEGISRMMINLMSWIIVILTIVMIVKIVQIFTSMKGISLGKGGSSGGGKSSSKGGDKKGDSSKGDAKDKKKAVIPKRTPLIDASKPASFAATIVNEKGEKVPATIILTPKYELSKKKEEATDGS